MKRILFKLTALLAMQSLAFAGSALQWDHKLLEFHPAPTEKAVKAEFSFTNISSEPVTIGSVRSSCGCTTVGLDKKTYQPGEKGHVTAIFTIGSRRGVQVKAIRVAVQGEPDPAILSLVANLSVPLKIDPEFVFWQRGEDPCPKIMKLAIPSDSHLRPTKVSSNDPRISTTLETVKAGSEYRIVITPDGTAKPAMAILTVEAALPSNQTQVFHAYAQVKGQAKP